jgi:hypothetical protein
MPSIPAFVVVSLILWLISCFLPSLGFGVYSSNHHRDETSTVYGLWTLAFGCCCGYYYYQFASYANFLLVASYVFALLGRSKVAVAFALGALALALDTLRLFGQRLDADEGGVRGMYLEHLRIGFYLWLASILIALAGSLWTWTSGRLARPQQSPPTRP